MAYSIATLRDRTRRSRMATDTVQAPVWSPMPSESMHMRHMHMHKMCLADAGLWSHHEPTEQRGAARSPHRWRPQEMDDAEQPTGSRPVVIAGPFLIRKTQAASSEQRCEPSSATKSLQDDDCESVGSASSSAGASTGEVEAATRTSATTAAPAMDDASNPHAQLQHHQQPSVMPKPEQEDQQPRFRQTDEIFAGFVPTRPFAGYAVRRRGKNWRPLR